MAEAVAQPSPALQSSPAASVSAAQLEKQSNALNQLLGSLRQEISCIEAQQQRLLEAAQAQRAAEEEEQRKAAAAAAAAVAAAAADSEAAQQLENRQAQLARLQALLQQPGLTPSETHALSKLIAGVQQEIAATQARRSPPVAAAAAAPPLAAPHGGASGQRQYMRPAQQQQQQQPAPQQQPAKQQQQQQQPGGTQRSTPRTSSGGGDAAGAPAASQMLSQLIGQLQREIATIGQEPGPTDAALQAQRGTAGAAGTPQLGGSGSLQRSGSLGQRPGSSSGGCASLDVQPPVAVGTNGKPPLVQQASDSAQEWEVWQHLEGSSSLSSPALRQLLLHQLEKRAGGAALPVHAAALAVGLDGAAGGRSASGLTPITPAERDAAVAASLGLVGEPSEGQESAAAAFLARMTAVHSLQQRLVQRHQQRRQRALQLAQQRYGQLQQAVLTEREAPPSRLASLKTEHVAAAEAPAATAAAVPAAVPASLPMPSAAVAWPAAAAAEEEAEEEAAMLRHAMLAQQAQRAQQPVPAKLSGSAMALDVQRGGATSPSPFSDLSGAQGLQPPAFGSRSPSADGGRVPERSAELSFAPMARAGRQLPAVAPAPSSLPSLRLPSLQQQLPSPQQLGVRVRSPPSQPASQAPSREQSLGQQVSVGQHRSPSGGSQAQPGFLPSTGRAATSPEQAGAAAAEAAAAELQ